MRGQSFARRLTPFAAALLCGAVSAPAHAESESLLEKTLDTPEWLTVRGSHRTRFEVLHKPEALTLFERGYGGQYYYPSEASAGNYFETTGLVSLQSTLFVEVDLGPVRIGGELLDARSYFPVKDSISCNISCAYPYARTDAVEPLQAYIAIDIGNDGELKAGRFTMNLGSGRLVARSAFRNTLHSNHGVSAQIPAAYDGQLSLFYTLPYLKRFEDDNEIKYDAPVAKYHFFGAHYESAGIIEDAIAEAYLFGSIGRYSGSYASFPERAQLTPGARVYRAPKTGAFDFEVEAAAQFTIDEGNNDQFFGYFAHLEGGKTFGDRWDTRISLLFDVATGTDYEIAEELATEATCAAIPACDYFYGEDGLYPYPGDQTWLSISASNPVEFNPLFGANDRDFGPEGLFGAIPRRNIISPAVRMEAGPTERSTLQLTYRPARHFSPDFNTVGLAFGPDGVQSIPISGKAGWAHQLDARFDYMLFADNVKFSLGAAFFDSHYSIDYGYSMGPGADALSVKEASSAYYGYTSIQARF